MQIIMCENETCELAKSCVRSLKSGATEYTAKEWKFFVPYKVGRCEYFLKKTD